MLAYAANRSRAAGRAGSPKALTLIIAGHVLAMAAVLTAKPELVGMQPDPPPIIVNIPDTPKPPEPVEPPTRIPQDSFIPVERPIIDMDQPTPIQIDP